jgi:hypothetical protein
MGDRRVWIMFLRTAAIVAILALSGTSAGAQQFAPGEPAPGGGGRVLVARTTADLNLRNGPGTQYATLIRIPRGRTVQILGCTPNFVWCRTRFVGRIGWVSAAYLSPRPGAGAFPPGIPIPLPIPQPPRPQPPQAGVVTVTGTLTREGVECAALRADSGRLYTLTTRGRFQPGDRVRVTGTIAQVSFCQQGTTIQVRSIGPA